MRASTLRVSHQLGLLLAVSVFSHELRSARACGPWVDYVDAVLPASGADEVRLDAALIAVSSIENIRFSLRAVAASPDAGAADVPFDRTCYPGEDGAVCVAVPVDALQPSTHYEWKAEVVGSYVRYQSSDGTYAGETTAVWRSFTTVDGEQPDTMDAVTVELTDNVTFQYSLCGTTGQATFRFSTKEPASGLLLVGFAGITPSYSSSVRRFEPEGDGMDVYLGNPPDCVVPEVYDALGRRTELDQICPHQTLPAVLVDSNGVVLEPAPAASSPPIAGPTDVDESESPPTTELRAVDPEAGSGRGCSVGLGTPHIAWWLVPTALAALRYRRVARRRRRR